MERIRPFAPADVAEWGRMRSALWPEQSEADMEAWVGRADTGVIVAERVPGSGLCGFAEVGERMYADGCATSPVAYLEGWYVDPDRRRLSIGAQLIAAVEAWARERGYRELASDTTLDNVISQRAHERLGFAETERLVLYRKTLSPQGD
jgi:aminoglycoside 6'-N-acetyltransferase I